MRVLCSLVTLALITLALGRAAHADNRKEARASFASGEAADKRKDYRTAIEHYLKAYELEPHPFALYNIGLDYERLGEFREAAEWFNRYLQEAPNTPELDRINQLIVGLKLRPAKLTVTTKPVGARVFVDGQYSGSTPFSKPVKGGQRRIGVELAGQRDERDVFLEFGEPKAVEFTLKTVAPTVGPTGTLEVGGTPDGAAVYVDDQNVGVIPAKVDVIPGQHTIKVTQYGYVPFETVATVAINQTTPVSALLVQEGTPGVTGGATVLAIGYLIGAGGGIDVLNGKPIGLFDFGVRAGQYDIALRVGKASGLTAVDFIFRWAITKARVSPYVGAGYSYVAATDDNGNTGGSGSGGEIVGGIRWDISRAVAGSTSLIVESGFRYHAVVASSTMTEAHSGLIIPVMASFQFTYGKTR